MKAKFMAIPFIILIIIGPAISTPFAQTNSSHQASLPPLESLQKTFVDIAHRVRSSVVCVKVEESFIHPTVPGKKVPKGEIPIEAKGSGIVIDEKGHILTCYHVIKEAKSIRVVVFGGQELSAQVVGKDATTDLAVLKVESLKGLTKACLGDSDKIKIGEWAIAIGNPYGMDQAIRVGIISGIGPLEEGTHVFDFIQTDASIAPGDSGGPALNIKGEVIGIISSTHHKVGLMIPINVAKEVAEELIAKGKVTRGFLGVRPQSLTLDLAKEFGFDGKEGVLVGGIVEDAPADKGGIEIGDIILRFNKEKVTNARELSRLVARTPPNKTVEIQLFRNGHLKTLDIKIGEAKEIPVLAERISEEYGMVAQEITPELMKRFGLKEGKGVVISKVTPGTPASRAGVWPGDVIVEVRKKKIRGLEDYCHILDEIERGRNVLMLIKRGERTFYVVVKQERGHRRIKD